MAAVPSAWCGIRRQLSSRFQRAACMASRCPPFGAGHLDVSSFGPRRQKAKCSTLSLSRTSHDRLWRLQRPVMPVEAIRRKDGSLYSRDATIRQASSVADRGIRSTLPSTDPPVSSKSAKPNHVDDGDRGYLAFTKASLFKLTLPLQPPVDNDKSLSSKASSAFSIAQASKERLAKEKLETREEAESSAEASDVPWEKMADEGEHVSQIDPVLGHSSSGQQEPKSGASEPRKKSQRLMLHDAEMGEPADDPALEFDAKAPAHSVVFLLHSGQPLSYITSLIEAEGPGFGERRSIKPREVTFHSRPTDSKRWSPSTSIGDFLRDAARIGSFAVRIWPPHKNEGKKDGKDKAAGEVAPRNIVVAVPSFEDRTRFLRAKLYSKTAQIEHMAKQKADCDAIARQTTRRFAIAGGVVLGVWWAVIFSITFFSKYGWDLAEPITYLCGLGTLMAGYTWFLIHNREVSYRAVLSETTTRRQQRLYIEKGLNIERYEELIEECKELRKQVKKVAEDYDLEWDQSKSSSGNHKRALEIVQKREAQEQQPVVIKSDEDGEGQKDESEEEKAEEKEEGGGEDKESDGKADGKK